MKYGFVDHNGELIVPCMYDNTVLGFVEGRATVGKRDEDGNMKWGFIDETGREVVPLTYDGASLFTEGMGHVWNLDADGNEKHGYIDKAGNVLIPLEYDDADTHGGITPFHWVRKGTTYGIIRSPFYSPAESGEEEESPDPSGGETDRDDPDAEAGRDDGPGDDDRDDGPGDDDRDRSERRDGTGELWGLDEETVKFALKTFLFGAGGVAAAGVILAAVMLSVKHGKRKRARAAQATNQPMQPTVCPCCGAQSAAGAVSCWNCGSTLPRGY